MRLLFIKESLAWPRNSGHDVHCYHLMKALAQLGHEVSLATAVEPVPEALNSLPLAQRFALDAREKGVNGPPSTNATPLAILNYWQERFRSYWGISADAIRAAGQAVVRCRADAVVVVGLNVLPYLGAVQNARRVWYAADEWVWHHLGLVRWQEPNTWEHVRSAAIKGLYERVYAPLWDRVWVVSATDRRALRWVTGSDSIDVLPNGVDNDYFQPRMEREVDRSCIFWGRLDFDPNVRALQWFCRSIWPALRQRAPDAQFKILGFQPSPAVRELAGRDGISLIPDLPDIRTDIARSSLVVLPFRTTGGIKNKLLEAASMGKAIVGTPQSCGGLRGLREAPFMVAQSVDSWATTILELWADEPRRRQLGLRARNWVLKHHTWIEAARRAVESLKLAYVSRPLSHHQPS
jgi:glycosyltransferase involved in cell wall biosynthesis